MQFDSAQRGELLALARESIESGLSRGEPSACPTDRFAAALLERQSSFVTLRIGPNLRGCCGTIDAPRPLAEDVWYNACASAFSDPRFPRLEAVEWPRVHLHLSILSKPEAMPVASEQDLLARLQPSTDGLILEYGASRATFLPSVWEQIGDPMRFLHQLKLKAGWPADFWSPEMRVFRYTAESFGESG